MSGFHFHKGHQYKCTMKKTLPELYFKRLSCRVLLWNFANCVDRRFYLFGACLRVQSFHHSFCPAGRTPNAAVRSQNISESSRSPWWMPFWPASLFQTKICWNVSWTFSKLIAVVFRRIFGTPKLKVFFRTGHWIRNDEASVCFLKVAKVGTCGQSVHWFIRLQNSKQIKLPPNPTWLKSVALRCLCLQTYFILIPFQKLVYLWCFGVSLIYRINWVGCFWTEKI